MYAWLFAASSAARAVALRLLYPVGTLRLPRAAVQLRTLAMRPDVGAIQRPIVATFEPSEAEATFASARRPVSPRGTWRRRSREDEAAGARVEERQEEHRRQ